MLLMFYISKKLGDFPITKKLLNLVSWFSSLHTPPLSSMDLCTLAYKIHLRSAVPFRKPVEMWKLLSNLRPMADIFFYFSAYFKIYPLCRRFSLILSFFH